MRIAGYEFSEGFRPQSGAQVEAKEVGQHLELLRKEAKGELTPEDVLKDAENSNSPLHAFFEWSDTEAARQYRLSQARTLIRAVVAVYVDDEKPARRMKAFVHINEPGAPHYRDTAHAMSVKRTRDMVLKQAWRELQAWRNRYKDLAEFAAVFEAMENVQIEVAHPRVKAA